jgi:hypothetical protein
MVTILHYIDLRTATIFRYVVDRPIYVACRKGREWPPRQWWWEQKMSLVNKAVDGANE